MNERSHNESSTMLPTILLAWTLVAMATMPTGQGHKGVHTVEVMYHSSVNFTCNSPLGHDLDLSVFTPSQLRRVWILPNSHLIDSRTASGHDEHVAILDNGALLHVKNVEDEDFGWYHCVIHMVAGDSYLLQKYGLNVNGPYWGDLYEHKYKSMLTTGLVAGAICFVCMGLLCFLYGRQQARLDKLAEEEKAARMEEDGNEEGRPKPMPEYVNPAFTEDTENADSPQKPVTQHTKVKIVVEEDGSGKEGPAPSPPAEQQELQNVVADGADANGGNTVTIKM